MMILAPVNSCMMMEPVTMGPIPRCMMLPEAPARIARKLANRSSCVSDTPYSSTLVSAKYSTRQREVQKSFVLNWTWPSGLVTAGHLSMSGFNR